MRHLVLTVAAIPLAAAIASAASAWQPSSVAPTSPSPAKEQKRLAKGDPVPDFSVAGPKNETLKLADFQGKVLVLDVSATWCGPCQAAMPNNDRVFKKYAAQGVMVLGITADDTREAYDEWLKKNEGKYSFIMAFDPAGKDGWKSSVFNSGYSVSGFPTMFVVGRDGRLVETIHGGGPGEDYRLEYALARAGVKVDLASIPPEPKKTPGPASIPAMTKTPAMRLPQAPAADPPPPANAMLGQAPPPITVAKWVKGEPLKEFEKGKVYVVDFWATWCGPCKAAIPHLTRLAQQHKGKLEVVGISISERQKDAQDTSYIEAVEQFVKKMDDRMDYRVAVDTPDKQMHATWFKKSGTGGIPTAWIIDQQGKVAWIGIGSPADVERIVGEVLAGTFNPREEAERQRLAELEAKKRSEADIAAAKERNKTANDETDAKFPGYRAARERGDTAAAIEALNAAFKADPASKTQAAYQWKLMLLMQRNKPEEITGYVRDLLDRYPDNSDIVGFASACIVSTGDESRFDPQLTLRAAKRALELAKPDSRWQQFARWRLGWAYFHTGDREHAVEAMQSALDGIGKLKDRFDFGDLAVQAEDALKVFRNPKGK